MMNFTLAEYIWIDGAKPTRNLRSKARVVNFDGAPAIEDFPEWSFDGSSTEQATGNDSDCILKPVTYVNDPIRGEGNFLVMCEVMNPDGTPHESNSRAQLREMLDAGGNKLDMWLGFEQEYTLYRDGRPLGFPENGEPAPQGPYYCGAGADRIFGREVAEHHAALCLETSMLYYGMNAEVMPGQWEFQIGYRGSNDESASAIDMADQTWLGRWLLQRVAEEYDVTVSFDNKPMKGDWNGAGMHTNVSTTDTRDPAKGRAAIEAATQALGEKHAEHIALYGAGLSDRLTGKHETCDINTFRVGDADRGCSVRIPKPVAIKGYGYFEDRRPGANADPYLVAARLMATMMDIPEEQFKFKSWPRQCAKLAIAAE
jgi:glutamine synthetase